MVDWRAMVEKVWQGRTVEQACDDLGYDYLEVLRYLNSDRGIKALLVDTAMLAKAREDILTGM